MTIETQTIQGATNVKTMALPSGRTAQVEPFLGKHIRVAQRIAGDDQERFMFALIAQTVTIDGNPVTAEDLDEMDGADVLQLMGEFAGNLSPVKI